MKKLTYFIKKTAEIPVGDFLIKGINYEEIEQIAKFNTAGLFAIRINRRLEIMYIHFNCMDMLNIEWILQNIRKDLDKRLKKLYYEKRKQNAKETINAT